MTLVTHIGLMVLPAMQSIVRNGVFFNLRRSLTASPWLGLLGRATPPHHEGLRPHPEERAAARVSKDEARFLSRNE